MTELRAITEEIFIDAFDLKLAPGQEDYVSHPIRSLAQAYVYRDQCQPFGIYTMDSEILDSDGFPKYVQLLCDDSDGNAWSCCYNKLHDCNNIYYYPGDIEII
ncbi:MAG: hypothetical protein K5756_06040 [Clostridiales bacterium]|nr:hypothetical protein [Clostridiales bacterium]